MEKYISSRKLQPANKERRDLSLSSTAKPRLLPHYASKVDEVRTPKMKYRAAQANARRTSAEFSSALSGQGKERSKTPLERDPPTASTHATAHHPVILSVENASTLESPEREARSDFLTLAQLASGNFDDAALLVGSSGSPEIDRVDVIEAPAKEEKTPLDVAEPAFPTKPLFLPQVELEPRNVKRPFFTATCENYNFFSL